MKILESTFISRNPNFIASKVDSEIVMMDVESGLYYGLDPVGSKIWELLEHPIQFSKLKKHLLELYKVDPETCSQDTLPFIQTMSENKLLILE